MRKKYIYGFILTFILSAIGGFIYFDLAPYLKSTNNLGEVMVSTKFEQNNKLLEKDMALYELCSTLDISYKKMLQNDNNEIQTENEYRQCLMNAFPKVQTIMGAIKFVNLATFWVKLHPEDEDLQKKAAIALKNGWCDLERKKPTYLMMQKVAEAHNNSIIMRLLDEDMKASMITTYENILTRLENGLSSAHESYDEESEIKFNQPTI